MRAVLLVLAALMFTTPAAAQRLVLDPEPFAPWRIGSQRQHIAAGAALDVLAQLPILPKTMRDTPFKRVLLVTFIGVTYEAGQESVVRDRGLRGNGYGFGLADLACDVLGAVAIELVVARLR